jgi:acyl carrier protein
MYYYTRFYIICQGGTESFFACNLGGVDSGLNICYNKQRLISNKKREGYFMGTFDKLRILIADVLGVDEELVRPETVPDELEADSIDLMDIVGEAEQLFRVEVTDEAIEGFETFGDLANYIDARL